MFHCGRCRTSFNATVASASGDCPRCRARDGVASPLHFRLFDPAEIEVAGLKRVAPKTTAPEVARTERVG